MSVQNQEKAMSDANAADGTSLVNVVNRLLEELLPAANAVLPKVIVAEDLDPWPDVTSGKESAGSVDLGVCDATAYAKYYVANLTGLKRLQVTAFHMTTADVSGASFSGDFQFHVACGADLEGAIGGSVEAECGFLDPSVSLSGVATGSGCQAHGAGHLTGEVSESGVQIETMTLTSLGLSYANAEVSIDGLGVFNSLIKPISSIILDAFEDAITSALAPLVKDAINTALKGVLPMPPGKVRKLGWV